MRLYIKEIIHSTIFCIMFCFSIQTFAQNIQFQKLYYSKAFTPGIKNSYTNFYDVESFSDGGFVTLGFLTDTFNRSEGIITKYDCLGNPIWSKGLGPSGSPTNTNMGIVEADSGDVVFTFSLGTGFFQASILCGRISAAGKVKWMRRIGNNLEFGRDIVMTRDSGFVVVGSTGSYGSDRIADDLYMFKLDRNGNILWTKTFGNPSGTYDEAYAVKTDSEDNLIITGRCIADSTFQAFILKASPLGVPLYFKTYGYHNQRTNAFDLVVDSEDNYLITGFTTILEENHQSSEYDVFLIKTDSALNTYFTNIYEVSVGSDAGSIGEGLAVLADGSYAIGVSTFAFTAHGASGPNSPNKNALYIINQDGSIKNAFIYNMKGSQYTRVRRSAIGGVILSGFSTAYASNVAFQGLIIKTDDQFLSGCHDIDVTFELSRYQPNWTIADFTYQTNTGQKTLAYTNYKDTSILFRTECASTLNLNPLIDGPKQACPNTTVHFKDFSTGDSLAKHIWSIGNDVFEKKGDVDYIFTNPGTYKITKIMQYGCISVPYEHIIVISPYQIGRISATLCAGKPFTFNGRELFSAGIYSDTIKLNNSCDSIIILTLSSNSFTNLGTLYDTITCGFSKSQFGLNYSTKGNYFINIKNQDGCDSIIGTIQVAAFANRVENPSICSGDSYLLNGKEYRKEGIFVDTIRSNSCDEIVTINLKVIIPFVQLNKPDTLFCNQPIFRHGVKIDKPGRSSLIKVPSPSGCDSIFSYNVIIFNCEDCVLVPNIFTPENNDDLNNVFRPIKPKDCPAELIRISFNVYNRWGLKVYESNDLSLPGWNGRYKDTPAPMESYIYHLNYDLKFGDDANAVLRNISKKGSVTLIR